MSEDRFIERPPRLQPPLPEGKVEIPAPPAKPTGRQTLIEMLLPLAMIVAYLLMAISGRGRSLMLVLPMGLMMGGSVFVALRRANAAEREYQEKLRIYRQRLVELHEDMLNDHQLQRDFYYHNFPDPIVALDIAQLEARSRLGPRVWERRSSDPDFGALRLGIGTRLSTVVYALPPSDDEISEDYDNARRLAEESLYVHDVPVAVRLKNQRPDREADATVRHTLGVYSLSRDVEQRREDVYQHINALLVHYTTLHSPVETRLLVVGTTASRPRWEWAYNLPHTGATPSDVRLCFEDEQVATRDGLEMRLRLFWNDLRTLLRTRQQRLRDDREAAAGDVGLPFVLLVIDMMGLEPRDPDADGPSLHNVAIEESVSLIVRAGQQLGAAVVFLADDPHDLPAELGSVIELERMVDGDLYFRYAEVGVNTPRYVGLADAIERASDLPAFAQPLGSYRVQVSAAAALPNSVDLLEMHGVADIDELDIQANWQRSRKIGQAEWPRVAIGVKNASERRELVFSASADGVHGMIAGTTGSGKSELLLTLINGLAMRYDPTIVNFVLVDFKGGAAFDEFRALPHVVDIVTNLGGNAVDRMFDSIKAELDRRSAIITEYGVKHIIEYRNKGYHLPETTLPQKLQDKGLEPQPFPTLFIIIDEFAEMVSEHQEYKAQLDSITRLGRAIGVSLILATQQPAGMVTDQMRANMKFKICLRVENMEDSRELLRRPDAAFLPTGIPGRAYVQIGNELPEMIQVARSGGPYRLTRQADSGEEILVIWPDRHPETTTGDETLSKVMVGAMAMRYRGHTPQTKPWPDPLPAYLPLNAPLDEPHRLPGFNPDYLWNEDRERLIAWAGSMTLNPALNEWLAGGATWNASASIDWVTHALRAPVGLIDHARKAHQRLLWLDLRQGNVAVFGGGRWGKTTFLTTCITALAATHSPLDLNIYVLDFGGKNLTPFEDLPHVGAVIDSDDSERIRRLLRLLNNTLDERRSRFEHARARNFLAYNQAVPGESRVPAVLVVIDNFAEVRENYEELLPAFVSLLREGPALGVYFMASGDLPNSMGSKVFNQFGVRLTLRLPDSAEYAGIVGRGRMTVPEIRGRGLIEMPPDVSNEPLEIQVAAPLALHDDELKWLVDDRRVEEETDEFEERAPVLDTTATLDELNNVLTKRLRELVDLMRGAFEADLRPLDAERQAAIRVRCASPIGQLPELVDLSPAFAERISAAGAAGAAGANGRLGEIRALVGIDDRTLTDLEIDLSEKPHFVVMGPPISGKTTLLTTWIMSLAATYTPQEVAFVLVDPRGMLGRRGGHERTLADLPHVLATISEPEDIAALPRLLEYEVNPEVHATSPDHAVAIKQAIIAEREARREEERAAALLETEAEAADTNGTAVSSSEDAAADTPPAEPEISVAEELAGVELPVVPLRQVFIFVDNYDELIDILPDEGMYAVLGRYARRFQGEAHFVMSGSEDMLRDNNALRRQVWQVRYGFALRSGNVLERLGGRLPRMLRDQELPPGRGFLVRSGLSQLAQIGTIEPRAERSSPEEMFDTLIGRICMKHDPAMWYWDLVPPALRPEDTPEDEATSGSRAAALQATASRGDAGAIRALMARREAAPAELRQMYARNAAANAQSPFAETLDGGANLYKLTSDLLLRVIPELDSADDALALRDEPGQMLRLAAQQGTLPLPTRADANLLAEVKAQIAAFDLLHRDLVKLPPELLSALGVVNRAGPLDALADMKPVEVEAAIRTGKIELPGRIPPDLLEAARAVIDEYDAKSGARDLLTAENLLRLTPDLLLALGMDEVLGYPVDRLHQAPLADLEAGLEDGSIPLPPRLDEDLRDAVRARLQIYADLSGAQLCRLSPRLISQLEDAGLNLGGMTPEHLLQASAETVQGWIDARDVELPAEISQDMRRAIRRRSTVVDALRPARLALLPPPLWDALIEAGLQAGDRTLGELVAAPEAQIEGWLASGALVLPDELAPDLQKALNAWNNMLREITPLRLSLLPPPALRAVINQLGIGLDGITFGELAAADSDTIAQAIQAWVVRLPLVLTPEQVQAVRDLFRDAGVSLGR